MVWCLSIPLKRARADIVLARQGRVLVNFCYFEGFKIGGLFHPESIFVVNYSLFRDVNIISK